MKKVLLVSHTCYFDTYNGASVASRSLMECLARRGFDVEVLTGSLLETSEEKEIQGWLAGQGVDAAPSRDDSGGMVYRARSRGVGVTIRGCGTTRPHATDEPERASFAGEFPRLMGRLPARVVVSFGGDPMMAEVRRLAKEAGSAVVFALHNFNYSSAEPFDGADAVLVPSRFAASFYRRTLGLDCTPIPYLIDPARGRVATRDPRFVTFVNPSPEKGVYIFARIADELGRLRPDIPLLVVEGRGTERTLVDCGIDLRAHGNVHMMNHTPDPRDFWGVTRIALMPSLWWENQPLVAIEAMSNGIPVIGSDRGGIPETLGDGGIVLGIPPRFTPFTRDLPTPEEVAPWVRAVIRLWDDPDWYAELSIRAGAESQRWAPEVVEPRYVDFFTRLCAGEIPSRARR